MNKPFTLYHSGRLGVPNNCLYPHSVDVVDEASMKKAVSYDYVAVAYADGYRNNENFLHSNCLMLDCDNDHSEDPAEWVTPDMLRQALPGVCFAIHYSRNHNRVKGGRAARPKFHCFFPISDQNDPEKYKAMKQQVQQLFPFFDPNAVDAARFFFGTNPANVELFDGEDSIEDVLMDYAFDEMEMAAEAYSGRVINEGSRNNTMSHFAGRILKRYGDTEAAYNAFIAEAEKCSPPLDPQELNTIWRSALQFHSRVKEQVGYIPPDQYNAGFQYEPDDYTDVGEAALLSKIYGEHLRFSPATDYICYNGIYWDESKHGAQGVVQELTSKQLTEAQSAVEAANEAMKKNGALDLLAFSSKKKAESAFNKEQATAYAEFMHAKNYEQFSLKRRDSKNIAATLKEARPMLSITPLELDSNEYLLCTPTATYDLRYGMASAREHKPEDFMTKVTAVSPGEEGRDLWEQQLDLVFCGDQELKDYVQLVAGLACFGKVFLEAMIIAYGVGANGKSTFWNTVSRVLGTYSGKVSADALTVGCRRNIKPELAELKGERMVIASELEEGMRLNTSTVKQMTSTDPIYAEKKYKDPFSFIPSHTLVLYTNHLPKVGAIDEGTWRRLIVVPFNARIVGNSDIKNYGDYLFEHAGGAILAWIIEGAKKAYELGYKIPLPAVVAEATEKYREQNNWLAHFINDRCETGDGFEAKSGEFYQAYRTYCAEVSDFTRSTAEFYTALESAGFERRKTKRGNFIVGVRLKGDGSGVEDEFLN